MDYKKNLEKFMVIDSVRFFKLIEIFPHLFKSLYNFHQFKKTIICKEK